MKMKNTFENLNLKNVGKIEFWQCIITIQIQHDTEGVCVKKCDFCCYLSQCFWGNVHREIGWTLPQK